VRNSERATGNPELIETAGQRTEETERGDLRYRGKLAWCPTNNDTSAEEHAMLGYACPDTQALSCIVGLAR
jgi:hypothetical protein